MENVTHIGTKKKNRISYDQAFSLNGKVPPQSLDIEEAVLGALMLDQDALANTIESIRTEYFYKIENQIVFDAIKKLFEESKQVDILTVVEELQKEGNLQAAGGSFYVTDLTNRVASAAHIEYHVRILSEKFVQRELIRVSTETITEAYDETTDVINLLDKTEQRLMDINDNNFRSEYRTMGNVIHEAMEQIEAAQNSGNELTGLSTGFVELDRLTAGFHPGTLLILAARPAMGKTAFALSMARNIAVEFKKPVAFFTLEMTAEELAMRLISSESEINGQKLKKGERLQEWEKQQLMQKVAVLSEAPIYIDETSALTVFELRAKCRRLKKQHDIQMVFIDYLQLMQGNTDNNRPGNREQEVSYISRQIKALAKELRIPILALSQLSRAVETRGGSKVPQLSDLRESGAIEQDADIVMFIHRPEYYGQDADDEGHSAKGLAQIILAKHRSGSVGKINLRFRSEYARFENMDVMGDQNGLQRASYGSALTSNDNFDNEGSSMIVESRINSDDTFGVDLDKDNKENEDIF